MGERVRGLKRCVDAFGRANAAVVVVAVVVAVAVTVRRGGVYFGVFCFRVELKCYKQ